MTEQLYFDDPLTLEFTARVTETRPLDGGRFGVVLPRTYFYPTSGGQEHDTGYIGEARVLDVYKENSEILHVVDQLIQPGTYPARIDRLRRIRAMQHHTAQHVLSASFLEVVGIDSLSANINGDNPSTIDLDVEELDPDILGQAERYANRIFFENRAVKTYYIGDEEVASLPFRKAPKVNGHIRVVEVEGLDYTPCGGTHCPNTGMVGLLKIVRTERVNQKLRIHFVAGYQALDTFDNNQQVIKQVARLLETGLDEIPVVLGRKLDQLKSVQTELETLRTQVLTQEAERLVASATAVGTVNLLTATFCERRTSDVRELAQKFRDVGGLVTVLVAFEGGKLSLIVTCAADSGFDARKLLQHHLVPLGLRGGGDASIAQGGGLVDETRLEGLYDRTRDYLLGTGTALS
jgi:alanyl-tRNA synthetase